MPFSTSAFKNKLILTIENKLLNKNNINQISCFRRFIDNVRKLVYVTNWNSVSIDIYDLNTMEKINEVKDTTGRMTQISSQHYDEETNLLYIGTRYGFLIVFDMTELIVKDLYNIDYGYDIWYDILKIFTINNEINNYVFCYCGDNLIRRFIWKTNKSNIKKLVFIEKPSSYLCLDDYIKLSAYDINDELKVIYNKLSNNIYFIYNYEIIIINNNIDGLEYICSIRLDDYINNIIAIEQINILYHLYTHIYKNILILYEYYYGVFIIINMQTKDKVYINMNKQIYNTHLGNNNSDGILFIVTEDNISLIDLKNIITNKSTEYRLKKLSNKSYVFDIIKHKCDFTYNRFNYLIINSDEVMILTNDKTLQTYKLSGFFIEQHNFNYLNIINKKLLRNDIKCLESSKLHTLNSCVLLNILSKV